MTNTIQELLDSVVASGQLPDDRTIRESVTKYSSVAERTEVAKKVRVAAKRIISALDSNLPAQAAEHAADVAESLSGYTDAGPAENTDEPWTRSTERQYQAEFVGYPRSYGQKTLTELLMARTKHRLTARDLDRVAAQVPEDERDAFRERLQSAGEEINRVFASGAQADARSLARQHAFRLGSEIPEPERVDPSDAVADDPRALAALLPRR